MNTAIKLVISLAVPLAIGGLSGFATSRGVNTWYPTLIKPSFNHHGGGGCVPRLAAGSRH